MKEIFMMKKLLFALCIACTNVACVSAQDVSPDSQQEALEASPGLNRRLIKLTDWVNKEIQLGHPVSDRLMQFHKRIVQGNDNQASSLNNKPNFEKLQLKRKVAQDNLVAKLKSTKKKCSRSCKKNEACRRIPIRQKDVGPNGLIIDKPGTYCFAESIKFKPSQDGIPAISIQSDYVTVDLGGYTLTEDAIAFGAFDLTSGIVIQSGYNFVTIKNGAIAGFSNHGILAQSINQVPTDHLGIIIEQMSVNNCGKPTTIEPIRIFNSRSGIGIDGASEVIIEDCLVSNITSMIETDVISSYFSDDVIVKNCIASNGSTELTSGGDGNGIIIGFFNNAIIDQCTGTGISSFFPIGIIGYAGDNLTINDCQGHNNNGTLIASGLAVQVVNNAVLTGCAGNENTVGNIDPTQPEAIVYGIFNGPQNFNVVISNCSAQKNALTANLITPVPLFSGAVGIRTEATNNVLIEDCVAMQNQVNTGVEAFLISGFDIQRANNVVLRNCVATDHSSSNGSILVTGFLTGFPISNTVINQGIIIDSCTAQNNVNSGDPTNGFGILFGQTVLSSSIVNCTSMLNNTGIGVMGLLTTGNLIENNTVNNNTLFGIQDISCENNVYIDNYSNNLPAATGVCSASTCASVPLTGNQNYCGLPNGTPVRTWFVGNPPAAANNNGVTGDKLDNLDVSS